LQEGVGKGLNKKKNNKKGHTLFSEGLFREGVKKGHTLIEGCFIGKE
jgi:hypothetical protein